MLSAKQFFTEKFASKIAENPALMQSAGLRGKSIGVDIDGSNGGKWAVDFDQEGKVSLRGGELPSDCTILCTDKTFEGMMAGTVNVPMAFLMRKIKVKGESSLAMKLGLALQEIFLKG